MHTLFISHEVLFIVLQNVREWRWWRRRWGDKGAVPAQKHVSWSEKPRPEEFHSVTVDFRRQQTQAKREYSKRRRRYAWRDQPGKAEQEGRRRASTIKSGFFQVGFHAWTSHQAPEERKRGRFVAEDLSTRCLASFRRWSKWHKLLKILGLAISLTGSPIDLEKLQGANGKARSHSEC
jgi:hypothetical protein